ncbi:MAG: hypothetical protein HRT90_10920 [Candidatus Margulisbacteria bacterium]|nr:hypothetical protein [Candidatus Margulisiibacteriota bacterium]
MATEEPSIPIFIISSNRKTVLEEALKSYEACIKTPFHVVIHDNASKCPSVVTYLKELESQGITVYWSQGTRLLDVRPTITDYLAKYPSPYYVVTDPDIALDEVNGDILLFYMELLDRFPKLNVVGPMLRIDDIPDHYPLKREVLRSHTRQFWRKKPKAIAFNGLLYQYQTAYIDSTFGLYRGDFPFKNHNWGIRTYAPYAARHLDWYLDPKNLAVDQAYYLEHANSLSHWGAGQFFKDTVTFTKPSSVWKKILHKIRPPL